MQRRGAARNPGYPTGPRRVSGAIALRNKARLARLRGKRRWRMVTPFRLAVGSPHPHIVRGRQQRGLAMPTRNRQMNASFFGELLQAISERGRAFIERTRERRGLPGQRSDSLVELCEELLSGRGEASGDALARRDDLAPVDADFVHLFSSWFNRGFLVLRRIDWSTPAIVLEKLIRYEAVHEIRDWADLRRRIDPPDRRCFAFFHPALVDEPLIFVEVALSERIPDAIAPILADGREVLTPDRATTATFYSISNCQRGLTGVTFGSFLIKQVVEEISRELPRLSTFVTLSPVPGFAAWLARERATEHSAALNPEDRAKLVLLDRPDWWQEPEAAEELREAVLRAAAAYFLGARTPRGMPLDPVARFHLGNGARLEQIDWLADSSPKGLRQSHGLMVNYLYDLEEIEHYHEAYAESRTVVASSAIRKLARNSTLHLLPAAS